MAQPLRSFLILTRSGDAQAFAMGQEVASWLQARQASVQVREHNAENCRSAEPGSCQHDAIVVLGGDGTFIGAARKALCLGIPVLGLNLGRVGFLAEGAEDWQKRLEVLLAGTYSLSSRLCLAYDLIRQGSVERSGVAVNDLVVSRGDLARLIRLSVSRGGEPVGSMRSDGLIISTPTGSTAYGFSAGGPLVHPEMEAFCITPVCPFLNNFRPMVVPTNKEIGVGIEEVRGDVRLTEDGQRCFPLAAGDQLIIRRNPAVLLMLVTDGASYFSKLSAKGFFTER